MAASWYWYCVKFCGERNLTLAFICWEDCFYRSRIIYLHQIISRDFVVPFCTFSATAPYQLATHITMCHTVNRPQVCQADIALRERAQQPPTRMKNWKPRNLCYNKRPCYRHSSNRTRTNSETTRRKRDKNPGNGRMIQLWAVRGSISSAESDECQKRNSEKTLQSPSFEPHVDSRKNGFLPSELQSEDIEQVKAGGGKSHKPGSS